MSEKENIKIKKGKWKKFLIIILIIIFISFSFIFILALGKSIYKANYRRSNDIGCFVMVKPSKGSSDVIGITQEEFVKEMKRQNLSKEELYKRLEREYDTERVCMGKRMHKDKRLSRRNKRNV